VAGNAQLATGLSIPHKRSMVGIRRSRLNGARYYADHRKFSDNKSSLQKSGKQPSLRISYGCQREFKNGLSIPPILSGTPLPGIANEQI